MRGEITLYAPMQPHMPILVRPGLLRKLHLRTSPFATPWEMASAHPKPTNQRQHRRR